MPPVSERQRRAMQAAAAGHSTLGIPKKVGEEFARSDPGGKLPGHQGQREAKQPLKSSAEKTAKQRKRRPDAEVDYDALVATAKNYARIKPR